MAVVPQQIRERKLGDFASGIHQQKYAFFPGETWTMTARRVAENVMGALGYDRMSDEVHAITEMIADRKFLPGGRYLYAAGRDYHQVNNCLLLRCEDSREGWAETFWQASMSLMTGAGIGVNYSNVRPAGTKIARTGGQASGPLSPMRIVNEIGRDVMQGGSRRSAIWAGLSWKHPDVHDFIRMKDWKPELRALKAEDAWLPMEMELTNISVQLDDDFFAAFEAGDERAHDVYWATVKRMCKTGEPGFSIDVGANAGEDLRNACTEITSEDDSDVCNLGSINLGRVTDLYDMANTVRLATLFLIAGTVYSDTPYDKVKDVRAKNRRLGLGLMGVHEWLLQRDKRYGPDEDLGVWLEEYARSGECADAWAAEHSLSAPIKTRAIAPNGTIGIIGETTTGMEPIFCVAYKRRYLKGKDWQTDYVIDPVAERMVEQGHDPEMIEDAYSLSKDVTTRLGMQKFLQQYVDHGISSTINLPAPITEPDAVHDFGETLYAHLPHLRGVTVYPDGARAGQPIQAVSLAEAHAHHAKVEGNEESCIGGICAV